MNTKEAIEWINVIWHDWENIYGSSAESNLESGHELDEIIELLKRGEKLEKMWGDFKSEHKNMFRNIDGGMTAETLKDMMDKYEENYLITK